MFSSLRRAVSLPQQLRQLRRWASVSAAEKPATAAPSDTLHVVLLGQSKTDALPAAVRAQITRLQNADLDAASSLTVASSETGVLYHVLKSEPKEWLVGGEQWRVAGGRIAGAVRELGLRSALVVDLPDASVAAHVAEGVLLGDYKYTEFRSGKEGARADITVHFPGHTEATARAIRVAAAQNRARTLADMPPNVLNPARFAALASEVLRTLPNVTFSLVQGVDKLTASNFPGLVQVGKAGSTEPVLVEMHYTPPRASSSTATKLALVGKGITFDSGGISIKPSDKMWEMKGDMSGAAAVFSAFTLIAQEQPNIPVSAYLALAENLPSSKAQRPGDIYRARNGKFIHVDNTDAEGRLVLADVLTYACEQGATHLVDAATLTGACMVALGEKIGGLMGTDSEFVQAVRQAGQKAGEELWPLPLYGEYRESINHPHADVNNSAGSRYGGTITAGLFLKEFVADTVKWAHLDIAGPAVQTSGWRYYTKGMTGFGTRTLAQLARDLSVV